MRGGLPLPITGTVSPFVLLYVQRDVMRATGTQRVPLGTSTSSRATPLYLWDQASQIWAQGF